MTLGAIVVGLALLETACRPANETATARCEAADTLGPFDRDFGESSLEDFFIPCEQDGLSCRQEELLTRQQAQCRAIGLGLPRGVEPLGARLLVDFDHSRPAWIVSSTEQLVVKHDDCGPGQRFCGSDVRASGTRMSIDARTGRELDRWPWEQHDDVIRESHEETPGWLRWLRRFTP